MGETVVGFCQALLFQALCSAVLHGEVMQSCADGFYMHSVCIRPWAHLFAIDGPKPKFFWSLGFFGGLNLGG